MLKNNINTLPEKLNENTRINDLLIIYHGKDKHIP